MPFDLWVTRTNGGGGGRKSSTKTTATGIAVEEFRAAFSDAPAREFSRTEYWVRHDEGDPWFIAAWRPEGRVLLSTSYAGHRFVRNIVDMFHLGLRLGRRLNAELREEVGDRLVTSENVDELVRPDGSYIALQVDAWRQAIEGLNRETKAPFEYPLRSLDSVSEHLVLQVQRPEVELAIDIVASLVEKHLAQSRANVVAPDKIVIMSVANDKPLAKISRQPNGTWQVWPWHGYAPFARNANAVIAATDAIHAATRGVIHFWSRPVDQALRSELTRLAAGLSVDFFLWMQDAFRSS